MSTQEYIDATVAALRSNNPTNWPRYQADPKAVWRYIGRSIGSGLDLNRKEDRDVLGTLYSQIVVVAEFGRLRGITISAKEFLGYVLETATPQREA